MSHFNEAGTSETASTNCRCKTRKKYSIFTPSLRSCASHRQKSKKNEKGLKNKSCQCGSEKKLNILKDTLQKVPSTDSSLSDLVNGQNLLKDFSDDFEKSIEEEVIEEFFSRKVKSVKKELTKEQKKLLAMEKPPLDRLKEIPVEYLKPRAPFHKIKNEIPEELENFLKNICQPPKMENLNKKKPYLHPNVEKMFHETFENTSHEITSGTQTVNWDKTVATQTEKNWSKNLQKKLFYDLDAERNKSFLIDIKTSEENWREFLAKQEEHKKINLIDPDLFKKAIHGPFYICSKVPLEKTDLFDKAVNTESFGFSEIETLSEKSQVIDTQKQAKGGGDTANKKRAKSEQEILESILAEELRPSDYLGCLKMIETITRSVMKLNLDKKSETHLKELVNLKEHHLKHILKEVDHLFELDKFFKTFSSDEN